MLASFNINTIIKKTYFIHLFLSLNKQGKKTKLNWDARFCRMGDMSYPH
jgi:hypothetical protein